MLLGGGCSPATEPLAALAGLFYNLTQVGDVGVCLCYHPLLVYHTLVLCQQVSLAV